MIGRMERIECGPIWLQTFHVPSAVLQAGIRHDRRILILLAFGRLYIFRIFHRTRFVAMQHHHTDHNEQNDNDNGADGDAGA